MVYTIVCELKDYIFIPVQDLTLFVATFPEIQYNLLIVSELAVLFTYPNGLLLESRFPTSPLLCCVVTISAVESVSSPRLPKSTVVQNTMLCNRVWNGQCDGESCQLDWLGTLISKADFCVWLSVLWRRDFADYIWTLVLSSWLFLFTSWLPWGKKFSSAISFAMSWNQLTIDETSKPWTKR